MTKNIVVFGASGGIGQEFVKQASALGMTVTAVVRSGSKVATTGENVKVMEGNLRDAAFVDSCVAGQDLVLSSLGLRIGGMAYWNKPKDPEFLIEAFKNIVAAMRKHGVKKASIVSAGPVGNGREKMSFFFRAIIIPVSSLGHIYPTLERMENVCMEATDLDFCIVRPPLLTDKPATGTGKIVNDLFGLRKISRAEVARWILEESQKPGEYAHKVVLLSDP